VCVMLCCVAGELFGTVVELSAFCWFLINITQIQVWNTWRIKIIGIGFSINVSYVVSELMLVPETKFIYKQTCNSVWCPSVIQWIHAPLICAL
jgi:hypothetical protein